MEKTTTATTKKTKSTEKLEDKIFSAYITYVLTNGNEPASIFLFTKELGMKESEFYDAYTSFSALEKAIWQSFFDETVKRIEADKVYAEYSAREKMLAFYYTWIEVLKQQRSYVTHCWKGVKKPELTPVFLKSLKESFHKYVSSLLGEGMKSEEVVERPLISKRYADAIWIQFLFVLNFWVKDESQGFESTDTAIEKAVNLSFDLLGKSPLDSMIDFAKFLYQNR